ncbi:uncharacterized protein LOC127841956 isoform X2 [Dreissena polymorpha]|uniref:ABC transmembrane type-1 domain-containing protein n=1 Tax=Dreissena polymorpha TaxID=45954 RepID=A0A9D4N1V1_DREPO|nr:uncharacterized protein LOC127841956 isoform X2 [Dreissena polymorpha]KAH3886240.1 hypothetical protein DPMN_010242 [Dreissena polymorpha]
MRCTEINLTDMQVHENTKQTMPIKGIVDEKNRMWIGLFIVTVLELISSLPAMIWPCGSSTEWNIDTFYDIINGVPIKALLILILALIIGILTGKIGQKNVNTFGAVTLGFIALVILYEFVKIFAAITDGNFDTLTTFCKMSIIASPICGLLQLSMLLGILGDARLKRDDQNVVTPKAYEFLMQFNKPEIPKMLLGWTFLCVSSMAQVMATIYFGQAVDSALDKKGDIRPNLGCMGTAGLVGYLCTMCRCWLLNRADLQTVEGIRKQMLNRIKNNEQAVFEKFKIDQLLRILTFDTQALPNIATWSKSVRYLLQIFGSLVGLFILNASLTICVLGVILVISLTSIFFGYHINKLQNKPKDRLTCVEDNAQNARATLEHDMKQVRKTETRLLILGVVTEGVVGWLLTAATVIVLYYGGTLLNKHADDPEKGISAGELTAIVLFLVQMGLASGYTLWSDSEPKQKIIEARKRVIELHTFLENGRPD